MDTPEEMAELYMGIVDAGEMIRRLNDVVAALAINDTDEAWLDMLKAEAMIVKVGLIRLSMISRLGAMLGRPSGDATITNAMLIGVNPGDVPPDLWEMSLGD